MSPDTVTGKCPQPEELSVWLDGESGETETGIAEHVGDCERCDSIVTVYRKIDVCLQTTAAPADALAETIKNACRNLPEEKKPVLWMNPALLRAAAAVVVVAAVSVFTVRSLTGESPSSVANANNSDSEPVETAGTTTTSLVEPVFHATPIQSTFLIGTDSFPSLAPRTERVASKGNAGAVSSMVTHVWVVDEAVCGKLEKVMKQSFPGGTWSAGEQTSSLRVVLPDQKLQVLVDFLNTAGSALVSPSLPQPGQKSNTFFTGKDVEYRATFVCRQ